MVYTDLVSTSEFLHGTLVISVDQLPVYCLYFLNILSAVKTSFVSPPTHTHARMHTGFSRSATFLHDSRNSLTVVAGNEKKNSDTKKLGFSCVGFWMKKLQYPENSACFYILLDREGGVVACS